MLSCVCVATCVFVVICVSVVFLGIGVVMRLCDDFMCAMCVHVSSGGSIVGFCRFLVWRRACCGILCFCGVLACLCGNVCL